MASRSLLAAAIGMAAMSSAPVLRLPSAGAGPLADWHPVPTARMKTAKPKGHKKLREKRKVKRAMRKASRK